MTTLASIRSDVHTPVPTVQNRAYATARLAEEIDRAQREPNYEFSILLVQFEGLMDITGRLGHAPTDDVWQLAINVLSQDLKPKDLCCRLGGDDFLVILPSASAAEAAVLVDRLRLRWQPKAGSREAGILLNAGCASYPGNGATVEALFAAADQSLYAYTLAHEVATAGPAAGLQQVA